MKDDTRGGIYVPGCSRCFNLGSIRSGKLRLCLFSRNAERAGGAPAAGNRADGAASSRQRRPNLRCKADGAQAAWTLEAPDAQLFDKDGKAFGKHSAGPSWQANDGSQITAKAAANVASPEPDSVPWLLLKVVSHSGDGVLSRVTSIQRLNTKGGKATASGCDTAHVGQEVRVPYSADYLFFAPK